MRPPTPCGNDVPAGYAPTYAVNFIHEYVFWAIAFFWLVYAIIALGQAARYLDQVQVRFSGWKFLILIAESLLIAACGAALFVLLALMGFFRNNCFYCRLDRLDSLWLPVLPVLVSALVICGLYVLIARISGFMRYFLTITLPLVGMVVWMFTAGYGNQSYLKYYCIQSIAEKVEVPAIRNGGK